MINIDDSYEILDEKYRGRKPKIGLKKDGKKYIFKYGVFNYESYAELIAEQLGIQAGIEMAHYEAAVMLGKLGVITTNFLKSEDLIMTSDKLREYIQILFNENNINYDVKDSSILNIIEAAWTYDGNINVEILSNELMKRWVFYGLILESDKNSTNISFIKTPEGLKLSPDYDNSSMCQLNKNINNMIPMLYRGYDIYSFTDGVNNQLHLSKKTENLSFLEEFKVFAEKYSDVCMQILESFDAIDVDKAIETVEMINKIDVPYEVKFWVNKVINTRLADLKAIYKNVSKKI